MKYKIGVFGSAEGDLEKIIPKVHVLAEALAKENVIILNGACPGLPYEVAVTAHKLGTEIWGYSQAVDKEKQAEYVPHDAELYNKLFFIPKNYQFASDRKISQKYRNVTSTANSDAGIMISGRWGTMNEFTNLHDMGKVIGVLTGTGGIADELQELMKKIHKPGGGAKVIFNSDPVKLVSKILKELGERKSTLQ